MTSRIKAWAVSTLILLMVIAAWSRISTMKETVQVVKGPFDAVSALFRGVFK